MAANEKEAVGNEIDDAEHLHSGNVVDIDGNRLLTFRLIVLYKLISRQASRFLGTKFGLSMAEWWILSQLGEHSPRTLRRLAEITFADKAQLSRAGASLLEKGYVQREPDPRDARSVLFAITPEGLEVKDAIQPARREFNRALLEQLSREEAQVLDSAIGSLTSFLLSEAEAD